MLGGYRAVPGGRLFSGARFADECPCCSFDPLPLDGIISYISSAFRNPQSAIRGSFLHYSKMDRLAEINAALAQRYTLHRELARGGMARVYLATDERQQRSVALKVLHPELSSVVKTKRFLREIEIACRLSHPHIVPVYESGEAAGVLYYSMPFIEGEALRDRLDREKQLPVDEAVRIALEIADALAHAHSHGVVHRDIKPDNVLLQSGHAVVADFGLARAIIEAGGERLTETGITLGTPAYISPEQASGERDIDGRSDIYSLGCVLFEMLAGVPPFVGAFPQTVVALHLIEPPPPLRAFRPTAPASIDAVIARAMAKKPADRYLTAARFSDALRAASSANIGNDWNPIDSSPRATPASPHSEAADQPDIHDPVLQLEGQADSFERLRGVLAQQYQIEREIGPGGMATVFLARDIRHGRHVALKVLRSRLANAIGAERFLGEIGVLARLQHPHVLPLIDSGEAAGSLYYVTPYVHGESLRERLLRDRRLSVAEAVQIAREAAEALEYAHREHIIHRDIKPGNILLSEGHAVVGDFGIARAMATASAGNEALTDSGIALGTPAYMSPEQASGDRDLDGRSDVYSLGCVLYEMLTGSPPFVRTTPRSVLAAHLRDAPVPMQQTGAEVPPGVRAVVMKSLSKNPDDRHQTAGEFRDALEASTSVKRRAPRTVRWWKAGAATIAAAGVLAAAWLWLRPSLQLNDNSILILPLEVLSPNNSLEHWRRSFVRALSPKIDGIGPLRTVSLSAYREWTGEADRSSAQQLGRRLDARLAVFGTLETNRDSSRLLVRMLDIEENRGVDIADLRSDTAHIFDLIDTVAIRIVAELARTRGIGKARPFSLGTNSRAALNYFLRGEEEYYRSSWDAAYTYYDSAVSADPKFALPLRRLGHVVGWRYIASEDSAQAYKLRAGALNRGLPVRDSLLVVADSMFAAASVLPDTASATAYWGLVSRLLATLRGATRSYPNDPEVWFALGDALYHYAEGPYGVPERDVLLPIERSIALDSGFTPAYIHAVELGLRLGGYQLGTRHARAYLARRPSGVDADAIRLAIQLISPNYAEAKLGKDLLSRVSGDVLLSARIALRRYPDSAQTVPLISRFIASGRSGRDAVLLDRVSARRTLVRAFAIRGRAHEALAQWGADAYNVRSSNAARLFVELVMLGAVPPDSAAAAFGRWLTDGQASWATYALPAWAARGDTTSIEAFKKRSQNVSPNEDSDNLHKAAYDIAASDAYLLLAKKNVDGALARFLLLPDTLCRSCWIFDRLTTGRLLIAVGRYPEAERLLGTQVYGYANPVDVFYALDHARAAEGARLRSRAVQSYDFVARSWGRSDSSLQPLVRESRSALERLRR